MLKNRWTLLVGANGSIGEETAKLLSKNGSNLILVAKDKNRLESLERKIENVEVYCFDVNIKNQNEIKNLFKNIRKITKKLDIVVNNAAVMNISTLIGIKADDIEEVFRVNLFSQFYILQLAYRMMLKNEKASIINISSLMGIEGNFGHSLYASSKSALIGFSKSLAKELAPVRVNVVAPSVVQTDMINSLNQEEKEKIILKTPLKRIAKPEEIANVILFLASDMSSFITSEVIRVDGGLCSI